MTSSGTPFWSPPKRFPWPLKFNPADPSHINLLMAASILRAESFNVPVPDWATNPKKLAEAVGKVSVPEFAPKEGVRIVTDEKASSLASASIDDSEVIDDLINRLGQLAKTLPAGFHMKPVHFEKVCINFSSSVCLFEVYLFISSCISRI
jgi:ubiquitin-activating enzyme E1